MTLPLKNSMCEVKEIVTFIKATREEALTLAHDIGGGEIHALHIMQGFKPAKNPVGYLVLPAVEKALVRDNQ